MRQYIDTLQDVQGNALVGATVLVQNFIGGANASIFSDNGLTPILTSTVATGADGQFSFFAADGDYNLVMSKNATIFKTQSPVTLFDGGAQLTMPDVGAVNAYATTSSALEKALRAGLRAYFNAAHSNTGASTFTYNTLAPKPIVQPGGFALAAGAINVGGIYVLEYDGANWQLLSEPGTSPSYQVIAQETAAGVVPVNLGYPPFSVDRYATNSVPGTTDMSAAFNKAVHVAMISGGEVTYGLTAPYLLAAAINCTFGSSANQWGIRIRNLCGTTIDPANQTLIAKHNAAAVFDCTGNDNITFQDLSLTTDAATFPQTGVLHARSNIAGSNSQMIRHFNSRILGKFSVACFYNYGSEDDDLFGCYFWNTNTNAGTSTRIYTGTNIKALSSAFAADPFGNAFLIRTGAQSCIDHNAFGCQDYNIAGSGTSDCVYLESTDSYKSYGGWAYSASASSNGRSLVYVDLSVSTCNFCVIDGLTGEHSGQEQANGILFSNNAQTPSHWSIRGCKLAAVTAGLAAGAAVTLDDINYFGNSCPDAGQVAIAGQLQNSTMDFGDETVVVIGTSKQNSLRGSTGLWTITTRNKDSWLDFGPTNRTIAAVVTSGGITSTGGGIVARAEIIFDGPKFTYQVLLASGSGNLAIAAGSTLTLTTPGGQPLTLADTSGATVMDITAGTTNGAQVSNTGSSLLITIQVAVGATPHSILVQGTAFVA